MNSENNEFYYYYDSFEALSAYATSPLVRMVYYVVCNNFGDVDQIYHANGTLLARYKYDAWDNTISITDKDGNAITSQTHIGNLNPIRYRGYYYDAEINMYYLWNRYYDPMVMRFLNVDVLLDTRNPQGMNLFVYCSDNPVSWVDPTGRSFWAALEGYFNIKIGVAGIVSGVVLLLAPEPTTLTKITGIAAIAGGIATIGSAISGMLDYATELSEERGSKRTIPIPETPKSELPTTDDWTIAPLSFQTVALPKKTTSSRKNNSSNTKTRHTVHRSKKGEKPPLKKTVYNSKDSYTIDWLLHGRAPSKTRFI